MATVKKSIKSKLKKVEQFGQLEKVIADSITGSSESPVSNLTQKDQKALHSKLKEVAKVLDINVVNLPKWSQGSDVRVYLNSFILYLNGVTNKEIGKRSEIDVKTLRGWIKEDGWAEMKKNIQIEACQEIAEEVKTQYIDKGKEIKEYLLPVTFKLGEMAKEVLHKKNELEDKDILKLFHDFSKLAGQFTGELSEKQDVSIGPNAAYEKILGLSGDEFSAKEIDPALLAAPKLIE